MRDYGWQAPTTGQPSTDYGELLAITCHPAVRIGFLDALAGKPLDHDKIVDRIRAETPTRALRRLGWDSSMFVNAAEVEMAQYRYEEGRLLVIDAGLRCKAWSHPDFPPAQVRDYILRRSRPAGGPLEPVAH
jgi:hypothetical protein